MKKFDSVIFDFDGTVADTGKGVFGSVRYAINKEGLPMPSESDIKSFAGPPLFDSFMRVFDGISEELGDKLVADYRENYSAGGIYEFDLYDGMEALLKKLRRAGVKTAIASSKPIVFIQQILDNCGLAKYFDIPVGATLDKTDPSKSDIVGSAKEQLAALGCTKPLMVGDRMFDIVGAKSQNVPVAAVLFGYGSREEFEEYGADYIVKDCDELAEIIFSE